MSLLIHPTTPFWLSAIVGGLLATLGAQLWQPKATDGERRWSVTSQKWLGQLIGIPAAALLVGVALLTALGSSLFWLWIGAALAVYLLLAWVWPRRDERRREQEVAVIRRLTPGLIEHIRVGLSSFETPLALLERYAARPIARRAVMQELVREALAHSSAARVRPFAALAKVARERNCRELVDLAEALAQAEAEGANVDAVLEAQHETIALILRGEFRRAVQRRTLYLLVMVAVSLVVGILINLLFVMLVGSNAFSVF